MEDDVRLCHAVRRAVGDRLAIMIDANHAYDATGAIALGRRIEELGIAWFEEPVPPEDLAGYREVKAALAMPIAGGEAEFTRWGFRGLIAERCVDILQPDIAAAGGISETQKIADMANAFGVRVNPHVWGTAVALAASLQLIAALPHNPPGLHPIEPLLEFDQSEHPIRMAVVDRADRPARRLGRDPRRTRARHRDRPGGADQVPGLKSGALTGEIGNWLIRDARFLPTNKEVIEQFCERVLDAGVPLDRASLHQRALHPQYRGVAAHLAARRAARGDFLRSRHRKDRDLYRKPGAGRHRGAAGASTGGSTATRCCRSRCSKSCATRALPIT